MFSAQLARGLSAVSKKANQPTTAAKITSFNSLEEYERSVTEYIEKEELPERLEIWAEDIKWACARRHCTAELPFNVDYERPYLENDINLKVFIKLATIELEKLGYIIEVGEGRRGDDAYYLTVNW